MPQTGATRYQKFLKSEKAKTKLKSKKDLPKGTNVTKTNFKVKKIVINEQLKKHDWSEALSARKLNVKELLTRLNHFNVHSRTEALNGLKELISSRPDVLDQSLGQLVNGVAPLVLNVEKVVRRESLKVLHLMLTTAATEKIEPFFDILSTYLRSSMTHIDNRIQEDSLLFLDILLLCTPDRIAKEFHKIIPNFLDMISKLRVDSKPGRTLTVNLDSQLTSTKWRVKVLHRLQDFLHKYVDHNISDSHKVLAKKTYKFDERKSNHFSLFDPSYTAVCHLSCFSSRTHEDQSPQDELDQMKSYIETLMPLLFETWLEVCPNVNKEHNTETVVNEDAAGLLKHMLEVISLIWELVRYLDKKNAGSNILHFFQQKYGPQFTQHVFQAFPYVTNIRNRPKSANTSSVFEDTITDPKLVIENLEICHLFINFNPRVNLKNQNMYIKALLDYVERNFRQDSQNSVNDAILKILQCILSNEVTFWTKNLTLMDSLFQKMILSYFNKDMSTDIRQKIFALLCQIALNDKLDNIHKSEAYENWLKNLPDILLEETITVQTIDIIQKFAVRNNRVFNSVVKSKLLGIVENLPRIKITDAEDVTSIYKLFSLLYWIKSWDNDSLNKIEQQLRESAYPGDHAKYIFDTLKLKSGGIC